MTVSTEVHLLDTPLPSPSLLNLLSNHLPHSLPVLRRLQYAANFSSDSDNNAPGTTPYSHVLYASKYSVEECLGLSKTAATPSSAFTSTCTQPQEKQQQQQQQQQNKNGNGNGNENGNGNADANGSKPRKGKKEGRKHFAAAFVDLSRFPETQAWVYSTLEDHCFFDPGVGTGTTMDGSTTSTTSMTTTSEEVFGSQSQSHSLLPEEEAQECDELMLVLLRRMRTIALQMPLVLEGSASEQRQKNWTEAREYLLMNAAGNKNEGPGPKVMIGSLAEIHRHRLFLLDPKGGRVHMHKTANIPEEIEWEVCQKWLFRTEALVSSSSSSSSEKEEEGQLGTTLEKEKGLVWDRVRTKEDVRLVQSRTSIKRQEDTLLGLPSVAVRDGEGGRMVAWGFMAFDGTLMTLHVEEQYRGKGLAKAVACKVMRDHVKDYGDDGWGAADVFLENYRSQGVCKSIGGRVGWLLSWAVVDLATVGDAL
ncbi:hypothetical protein GE21DRAFT_2519 [Neurospora crassa]|uniref:GCN5-related N-acetyltransferase Rv2170-like domain-containing protein n=1 Tax=Neurospora crassa (strain ATCC 24698 / 74-OR23-1A / CBS 708.71 / DSM 1257 / FGSC 987) TaxID=367110 RepID=Q7SE22_NEUCR|nr:hypothetical protein NCU02772 [Neurospora crassa OR74A]EAA35031.1 hypothetical protein NCU02772 [Neurospora crassa OR74A]KHE87287.1 hypothetical protein GE21DRAFT_2519 [Neurospora crassa]|eukprot:XP_964267.1 hypothetical protein NCU02772 [Neurospora crassa OR74A]